MGKKAKSFSGYDPVKWLVYLKKTDQELLKLCRVDVFLGSGKGGQKRNKTANAIRLTLEPLAVTATQSRSKTINRDEAIRKLRLAIATDLGRLSSLSQHQEVAPQEIQAYLDGELLRINPHHPLFPILVGFLLDQYICSQADWRRTADNCRISRSQLQRFVDKHPWLNEAFREVRRRFAAESKGIVLETSDESTGGRSAAAEPNEAEDR